MGLIKKILNGKARHFKVYRKCSECEDTSVKIVTSKSGRDLKALGKENAKKVLDEVYETSCSKCALVIEEMPKEEVGKANKVYSAKEVE